MDEADRLLDGSFDEGIADIFERLPKKRQTLLFTATVTDALRKLKEGEEEKTEEAREGKRPMFFYTVRVSLLDGSWSEMIFVQLLAGPVSRADGRGA